MAGCLWTLCAVTGTMGVSIRFVLSVGTVEFVDAVYIGRHCFQFAGAVHCCRLPASSLQPLCRPDVGRARVRVAHSKWGGGNGW